MNKQEALEIWTKGMTRDDFISVINQYETIISHYESGEKYHPRDKCFMVMTGMNQIHYYPDLLKRSRQLGYSCLIDAVCGIYDITKSGRIAGAAIGLHSGTIFRFLRLMGRPMNKRGGNNRVRDLSGWRGNIKQSGREFQRAVNGV